MPVKICNKLVRDKIPEIISACGDRPVTRVLGQSYFLLILKQKLLELAAEATQAASNANLLGELADLTEVIEALTLNSGFSLADLESVQIKKRNSRRGFEKKIFLEKVDEN